MVVVNTPVIFTDISTGNVSISWDFGDGTPVETGSPVSHTFSVAGTYRVTETIASSTGEIISCYQDIDVTSPISAKSNAAAIVGVVAAVGITVVAAYILTKKDINKVDR